MADKILFITLSNIGDAILTLPVLDYLKKEFPSCLITVLSGPRTKELFEGNPQVDKVILFDKRARLKEKISLFYRLKNEKFSAVIDLRNSLLGFLLPAGLKTSPFTRIPGNKTHMKERHLYRLLSRRGQFVAHNPEISEQDFQQGYKSLYVSPEDEAYIDKLLEENGVCGTDKIIAIAPGARSSIKRWPKESFSKLVSEISKEIRSKIVLVGDKDDSFVTEYISADSDTAVVDLSAKTSIAQLACLLKRAELLIANDSAITHLASYLNVPVVAVFGPTDEKKYGPWPKVSEVVKKDIFCRPCEKAQCRYGDLRCLRLIKAGDVLRQVRSVLARTSNPPNINEPAALQEKNGAPRAKTQGSCCPAHLGRNPDFIRGLKTEVFERRDKKTGDYKRILISRTDRIGDVLLSTPVIKALRQAYPCAYIAMVVSPYALDAVQGNPDLDEVISYDKDVNHKSWISSLAFAFYLKRMKFDLAMVLHPTNRMHLITFLAGIKRRIGYDRKYGFLLTDKLPHEKQLGTKHELEYTLDLVRYLGIEPLDKKIFMPLNEESERWVDELFNAQGIRPTDRLLGIHPAASCPSKIWPVERFAQTADLLAVKHGFRVLVVSGPKDINLAKKLARNMKQPVIDLAGKTSLSQLASVAKRCELFISNDSGPVHVASAQGVPVISIFGRNQPGLGPRRWGPVGPSDKALYKESGCIECLAHNCVKQFACLKAITVEDVINAADDILKG